MTDSELLDQVRYAIQDETAASATSIEFSSTANTVPGWDSLAHVRIIMNLESRLEILLDMDATYRAANVKDLIDIMQSAINQAEG